MLSEEERPIHVPDMFIDDASERIVLHEQVINDSGTIIGYISGIVDIKRIQKESLKLSLQTSESLQKGEKKSYCSAQTLTYYPHEYPIQFCTNYDVWSVLAVRPSGLIRLIVFVFVGSLGAAIFLAWVGAKRLQKPVGQLVELIRHNGPHMAQQYEHLLHNLKLRNDEFGQLADAVDQSRTTILQLETEKNLLAVQAAVGHIASQVAHDIRSPLTALRVVSGQLEELPEEKRIMIRNAVQRIEDIANDLAERKRSSHGERQATAESGAVSVQLLSSLIEPLVSEKRIQCRAHLGIEILSTLHADAYGIFAAVQPAEFKRVLSNLVNNAIEAMDSHGTVLVELRHTAEVVHIDVRDTGTGIPPEVLTQLMQRGTTFGKPDGSGLGLCHARSIVESWGGSLTLNSTVGTGTTAIVSLPRAPAPAWFVPELVIPEGSLVIIVDDDTSIHQVWQERFDTIDCAKHGIVLRHFSSGAAVREWYGPEPHVLFLCDYELLGESCNGLDLIGQLGAESQAVLVTSHYEEGSLRARCAAMGVRLIPKGLAGFVPLKVVPRVCHERSITQPAVLVIDDDEGIRLAWELQQQRLDIARLTTFASMEECEAAGPDYVVYDFAFVDKHIPDSVWRVDQVIRHLKAAGVKKVYVASGETAHALAADAQCAEADGILAWKVPERLPPCS
ncbi:MAG: hybrid sensor histidine kinase/response regulator [Deltaproteobacteria bacterium]|nr:hybrid sensor histidine kinase/response regulator [Deltaproteobacteria bacterium]